MDFTTLPPNHSLFSPTENGLVPLKWKIVHPEIIEYISIKQRETSLLLPCQECGGSFTVKSRMNHDIFRKRLRNDGLVQVPRPTCIAVDKCPIQFSPASTLDVRRHLLPDGNSTNAHGHNVIY
ncbi:hypothetical protein Fcan01_19802 [Folsomia candida]|uniref:Uncharacterized protein n=1 Tax=Folsomia candida TaxID=158441 RepID=A0A226DH71_FOLCA|nr:hypothetical protein Fcan01_19802 [Folsomia candida]